MWSRLNWETWVENVLALALHRPVAQALLLAHQLFDAPLPPATRPLSAEDQIVPQLVAHSIQLLTQSEEELFAIGQFNAFRNLPYHMKLCFQNAHDTRCAIDFDELPIL